MNTVYEYTDYKRYLEYITSEDVASRGRQAQLARAIGCQASYLSQVIRGRAELSEDQILKVAGSLKMARPQTEYLLLLVRQSRAGTHELVQYLEDQRQKLLKEHQDIANRVKAHPFVAEEHQLIRYFASWIPSAIHALTSSDDFKTPDSISKRLGLPLQMVQNTLQFLLELNLVTMKKGQYQFSGSSLHLPKTTSLYESHQMSWRMQAVRSAQINEQEEIHFSSVFMIDESAFKQIKEILTSSIEKAHERIHAADSKELYAYCVDFFRVI